MNIKEMFIRFWKTDNEKVSIVRDVVVALIAVFIILMILWGYTGQWLAAPMVAIESGSMEHPNSPFGRLGTIDAGDMVLVQKVSERNDLVTYGQAKDANNKNSFFYENWGDVIIYKPLGWTNVSQIIHRAMCWVDVYDNNGMFSYTIEEFNIHNATTLTIPELGLDNFKPASRKIPWTHSGYLSKGDHNDIIDQAIDELPPVGICPEPIKINWISGKARSEIPWVGTINLFFNDILHGGNTTNNVHQDSWICLVIVIAILISIPILLDVKEYLQKKKKV
jgi:signal peptidase I